MTPPCVVRAVWLMVLRVALGILSTIVAFATRDDLKRRVLRATPNATDSTVDTALIVAVIVALAVAAAYLVLAGRVRRGIEWARIATWVVAGVGVLAMVGSLTQPMPPFSRTLGVLAGLVDAAIIVLLALPAAADHFITRRRP